MRLKSCGRVLRKSSRSGNTNCVTAGNCRCHGGQIADTKDPGGPVLSVSSAAFTAFVQAASRGQLAA